MVPLIRTRCFLSASQASIHCNTLPDIPRTANFRASRRCASLSNALAKSRKMASTGSPESKYPDTLSTNYSKFDKQERPFLNLCWESLINPLSSKYQTIESLKIVTVLVNSLVGVARAQHASVIYPINRILLLTLHGVRLKWWLDWLIPMALQTSMDIFMFLLCPSYIKHNIHNVPVGNKN